MRFCTGHKKLLAAKVEALEVELKARHERTRSLQSYNSELAALITSGMMVGTLATALFLGGVFLGCNLPVEAIKLLRLRLPLGLVVANVLSQEVNLHDGNCTLAGRLSAIADIDCSVE